MDLTETGWEGVDWMYMAQDRDQWQAVVSEHSNEPLGSMKSRESLY